MANTSTGRPSPLSRIRITLLRLVLRTPLHGTVSRRFLLLRAVGGTPLDPPMPLRYAVYQPTTDEPTTDEPATDEPATDEPAHERPDSGGRTGPAEPTAAEPALDDEVVAGEVVVVMGKLWATWWKPLSADATPCTVTRGGRTVPMVATSARGAELDEAILRYLQKYPGEWKSLGIDASATADDVEAAARGQAVITFRAT